MRALDQDPALDYTGGPGASAVGRRAADWLDQHRGDLWGTLAILDYGDEPFVFEARQRVPFGANMAVRRRLIDRIGGFHPELGRRGGSLLGQEQAEFFARGRALARAGVMYPAMEVHHHVPAERLTKPYFRRWWYWKGVSRAIVDAMHGQTELGLDLEDVPYVAGVPRFVWGLIVRDSAHAVQAALRRNARIVDAPPNAMRLCGRLRPGVLEPRRSLPLPLRRRLRPRSEQLPFRGSGCPPRMRPSTPLREHGMRVPLLPRLRLRGPGIPLAR